MTAENESSSIATSALESIVADFLRVEHMATSWGRDMGLVPFSSWYNILVVRTSAFPSCLRVLRRSSRHADKSVWGCPEGIKIIE